MKVTKLETQTQLKISRKKPCRELSSRTIPHVPESSGKIRRKLICGLQFGQTEKTASPCARLRQCRASSTPENPPPRQRLFLVDEKVLGGAENFVDSLVAVFAYIGNTFKRSKNFSNHIFLLFKVSWLQGSCQERKLHHRGQKRYSRIWNRLWIVLCPLGQELCPNLPECAGRLKSLCRCRCRASMCISWRYLSCSRSSWKELSALFRQNFCRTHKDNASQACRSWVHQCAVQSWSEQLLGRRDRLCQLRFSFSCL